MVRALMVALLSCGCTLVVEHQLSSNPGGCGDLPFTDGSPGNAQRFHSGVSGPSFRGPAYPPPFADINGFGATLAFLTPAGLQLAGGVLGDTVFIRSETNSTPTWASPSPGHVGPGGFGCAEVLAAGYDTLHDQTTLQLVAAGCGNDVAYDGGTFSGAPEALSPAIAWAATSDGGAFIATLLGPRVQVCPETFPPTCFPPDGGFFLPAGGVRRADALLDAQGQPVWIVSTEGGDVRLYDSTFTGSIAVVSWSGPIAVLASDIAIAMRIQSGELQAQLFDATAVKRGTEMHIALGDAAAHGLEIARFGTTAVLRAAWIGGDGRARIATYDATVAAAQNLSTPKVVCGSQGASFVAPTSSTTAAVLVGGALYLRHAD